MLKKLRERVVPPGNFVGTIAVYVGNLDLSDADFRQLVRNCLPIVNYDDCERIESELREKLTAFNLSRTFKGKRIKIDRKGEVVRGTCEAVAKDGNGVIEFMLDHNYSVKLIPDSISENGEKIQGNLFEDSANDDPAKRCTIELAELGS